MPATKTGLFKGQQPGKGTEKEIFKALERIQAKTDTQEIVLHGSRGDLCSFKHDSDKRKEKDKGK